MLDWPDPDSGHHAAAELPDPAVDEEVESDEEDEGNKAIEDEVHIDNIDLDIVTVLSKTCGDHSSKLNKNEKDLAINYVKVTSAMVELMLELVMLEEGKTCTSVVSSMNLGIL